MRCSALLLVLGACSSWSSQYRDREWHALFAVPSQKLERAAEWVSIDGTAYPVVEGRILSPIEQAGLGREQLGVVEREMWHRSTDERGNFHGVSVRLHVGAGERVETRRVLVEVAREQPCRLGQRAQDVIVHACSGTSCNERERLALVGDETYVTGDVRLVVTVVCQRREPR